MTTSLKYFVAACALSLVLNSSGAGPTQLQLIPLDAPVDANGDPATSPDTELYNAFCSPPNPITAPDGHILTLAEWSKATGTGSVKCTSQGTVVNLHFSGLIPKGVYTIWILPLDSDGNPTGEGSLGKTDGSQNAFKASTSGQGQVSVLQPGGDLSGFGEVPACLTSGNFLLALAYHLDGQTHGGSPGDPCTFVVPIGFVYFAP